VDTAIKITRFHFSAFFGLQVVICSGVLLLHILISTGIIRLAHIPGPAGVGDGIAIITMPILGAVFFSPSFKYLLSQGISRRTYFYTGGVVMVLMAAVLAVIVMIFYVINLQVSNVWMIYSLVYRQQGLIGLVAWEFAALLFMGVLAWLVRLTYYVGGRNTRIAVTVAPFVLAGLLIFFNALAGGAVFRAIWDFIRAAMGLSGAGPNPYIGMGSLLAAAVVLSTPLYLLLRRAQVND